MDTTTCPQAATHHERRACAACGCTADGTRPTTGLQYDRRTSRAWLCFIGRPSEEEIAALKAAGWRWSGYRKEWNNPRRHVEPPAPIKFKLDGSCDYSNERPERLEARAEKKAAESAQAHAKVRAIADHIPFGQPILVGHHSERLARRDQERIRSGMRKAVDLGNYAASLEHRADSSERLHEYQDSYAGLVSRAERLGADVRRMERHLKGANVAQQGGVVEPGWADFLRRLELTRAELAEVEAKRDALKPAEDVAATVKVGDLVKGPQGLAHVLRVNPKSISVALWGGPCDGWKFKVPPHLITKNLGPLAEMEKKIAEREAAEKAKADQDKAG